MIEIQIPTNKLAINELRVGDQILISGTILCGRDAVLPKIIEELDNGNEFLKSLVLDGLIFHTAVSVAGVGPTSSNKLEIESSIEPLSKHGARIHLGKGQLHKETIEGLNKYDAIYCVIPPVTALLNEKTIKKELVAYSELGMEALYRLRVRDYPAIVAVAHGESIYDK